MRKRRSHDITFPPHRRFARLSETRIQTLPFDQLSWQDFEKLCLCLVRKESNVEHCKPYGVPGQAQSGIDIFARIHSAKKYRVYQCKNEQDFTPSKIKRAVKEFVEGEWRDKSDLFVLCTQESMTSTARAQEIETQAEMLSSYGILFKQWDREELSDRLKAHPDIVDDFFGRAWVRVFCGTEVAQRLSERLDCNQRRHLRQELLALYSRIFNLHDRGVPVADVLPLYERYVPSDVEWIETVDLPANPESASPIGDRPPQLTTDRANCK